MKRKATSIAASINLVLGDQAGAGDTATGMQVFPKPAEFVRGMRSSYLALIPSAGTPDPVFEVRSFEIAAIDPDRRIPVRLYVPATPGLSDSLPIVIFTHGGGFVSGDLDTHDVLTRALANGVEALVISVDYRLAPEHPFPAGVEDAYAVLQWAHTHAKEINGDPHRIALAGDSAGATLATVAAILARDRGGPAVAAQLLMYPTVSNKMDTASWQELGNTNFPTRDVMRNTIALYVPQGVDPFHPLVAPLWASLDKLPPALIQVGEYDPLRDENKAFAQKLNDSGVEARFAVYPGSHHGFIQFYKDQQQHPLGSKGLDDGVKFLRIIFSK